jgi:2-hydroxychromene-2-carboxylate isomerase
VTDVEFFFDPVCPWAWITSRWVDEVAKQRSYDVTWRFISLRMINEEIGYGPDSEPWREAHAAGGRVLRAAAYAREKAGNEAVAGLYTAVGTALHKNGQRGGFVENTTYYLVDVLSRARLDPDWANGADNEDFDAILREETDLAFSRTGKGVGTPILTFRPGQPNEGSFFGPVISRSPRGAEALRLWDAVETLATTSGLAELKRSLRSAPKFD